MRKRCRRQVWHPASGLEIVAQRSSKPPKSVTNRVILHMYEAIEDLRTGKMTPTSWADLAAAINAGRVLASDKRIGYEYLDDIDRARDAARDIAARAKTNGLKFVARAAELQALRAFAEIHDAQLNTANAGEMSDVAYRIRQLVDSGEKVVPGD